MGAVPPSEQRPLNTGDLVRQFAGEMRVGRDDSGVVMICLDGNGRLIAHEHVDCGEDSISDLETTTIFWRALHHQCVGVVMLRFRPEGALPWTLSEAQAEAEAIREKLLSGDLRLFDYCTVTSTECISLASSGLL
jgi:DNA repair protein RadC